MVLPWFYSAHFHVSEPRSLQSRTSRGLYLVFERDGAELIASYQYCVCDNLVTTSPLHEDVSCERSLCPEATKSFFVVREEAVDVLFHN